MEGSGMTEHVRAIWTDYGGVLTPPIDHTMSIFCDRVGVRPDAFLAAMRTVAEPYGTDIMAPLDTPLMTEEEWSGEMEDVLRRDHDANVDLSDFGEKWFTDRETNERWLDRLRRLRADGAFVGMLSNMVPSWDRQWRRLIPPDELFDAVVLSFEAGCRKPEQKIFDLAAERAGVAPAECVMVDDLAANCEGAVEAGWQAIHFTDTAAAIEELERRLAPEYRQRTEV
jgi:putative hydrolase of the HAD superfamily